MLLPSPYALASLAFLLPFALSAPNLNYPLAEQWPPVARVGKSFIFDLLVGTFNSTSSTSLTYTATGAPAWLSWNPVSLAFYGTPSSADTGEYPITLTASDGTGSTSDAWTLLVSDYSVPAVHSSFPTQIQDPDLRNFASSTALAEGSGVSVPPFWSFSLGFSPDTFRVSRTDPINGELYFAAHQRGTVSLPEWLSFNNDSFTFNGVAPASGTYTIVATGTDFWGYTGAQTSFVIEVGTGDGIELQQGSNFTNIVTMAGQQVDYVVDLSQVLVGGAAAPSGNLKVAMDNTDFPWLSLDATTNTITGTTPSSWTNGTIAPLFFPITISSTDPDDTLALTSFIGITVQPSLFNAMMFNTSATPGQYFAFDMGPHVSNGVTLSANVSPTDAASWLKFDGDNNTLAGTVPKSPSYGTVDVVFTATKNSQTANATLAIAVAGVTSTGSSAPSGTAPVTVTHAAHHGLSKGAKIALGVVFGLLGLIILAALLFCCCRRRREKREDKMNDGDSFVAGPRSPNPDPFRKSTGGAHTILGVISNWRHSQEVEKSRAGSISTDHTLAGTIFTKDEKLVREEKPHRLDGLRGIFGFGHPEKQDKELHIVSPHPDMDDSASFMGNGDVIGVSDPINGPNDAASSFTESFESGSGSSRASWESRDSFQWSSEQGTPQRNPNRISAAPSVPRPRPDFTPRYPRAQSPTTLARLTSTKNFEQSPSFSELGSGSQDGSHSLGSRSDSLLGSGSTLPSGPSRGAGHSGSGALHSLDEEGEDDTVSAEGPAVVHMAERQSLETRRAEEHATPQLRPSKEQIASPTKHRANRKSREAIPEGDEGMFDDADEARRSTYAPSQGGAGDLQGLGYPASEIFFSTPNPQGSEYDARSRSSAMLSPGSEAQRNSTIRAIPPATNTGPSPALPQPASFIRHRRTNTAGSASGSAGAEEAVAGVGAGAGAGARGSTISKRFSRPQSSIGANDGRVVACANETFSIHPHINPPPTVSLSAATWSSAPPSTYRAEVEGGGQLPAWLHFDGRELELWGVPSLGNTGQVTVLRILEKLPSKGKDPMSYGYVPSQEREVGRVTIECVPPR